MSALISLFNTDNSALIETVFVESCFDLVNQLDEEGLEKINEYVTLLADKKTKKSLESEISEALVTVMEHNAALFGTFLYEGCEEEISEEDAKSMLENIRTNMGREFVMEALSDKTKSRLKTVGKIGAGAAALGAAGWGAYKYGDDVKEKAGEIGRKLKDALTSPDKEAGTSQGMGANPGTVTAGNNSGVSSYKPNVGGMKRAVRLGGK